MDTKKPKCSQNPAEDISECRAAWMGQEDFAECLCQGPNTCQFALPFGYAFLCQHPRVREIVDNTSKPLQEVQV